MMYFKTEILREMVNSGRNLNSTPHFLYFLMGVRVLFVYEILTFPGLKFRGESFALPDPRIWSKPYEAGQMGAAISKVRRGCCR